MFERIEGLPIDALAVEATGKITHDDYVYIVIPTAEAILARGGNNGSNDGSTLER